jgi:hypothetical protein
MAPLFRCIDFFECCMLIKSNTLTRVAILFALYNLSGNLYGLELSIYESTLYLSTYPLTLLVQKNLVVLLYRVEYLHHLFGFILKMLLWGFGWFTGKIMHIYAGYKRNGCIIVVQELGGMIGIQSTVHHWSIC